MPEKLKYSLIIKNVLPNGSVVVVVVVVVVVLVVGMGGATLPFIYTSIMVLLVTIGVPKPSSQLLVSDINRKAAQTELE